MSLATSLENKIRANKKVVDMTWLTGKEQEIGKARWCGYPTDKGSWNITFPYQYTDNPLRSITEFPVGTVIDLTKLFPTPTEITKLGVTYEFSYWYLNPICGGDENTPVTSFTMPKYVEDDPSTHIEFIAKWRVKE